MRHAASCRVLTLDKQARAWHGLGMENVVAQMNAVIFTASHRVAG
jgi:hypothetical protein